MGLMRLGAALAGPLAQVTSLRAVLVGAAVLVMAIAVLSAPRLLALTRVHDDAEDAEVAQPRAA